MKNIFVISSIAVVLVLGAGYFVVNQPNTVEEQKQNNASVSHSAPADPSAKNAPNLSSQQTKKKSIADDMSVDEQVIERLEIMRERRPNIDFDEDAVAAAMQRQSAWSPVKEKPTNLPLEPELLNDGRRFFRLDSLKLETLVPGDTVKVNLEEVGQEYTVTIDRTEKHDYDSVSWYGHIETGDGQTYSVNFTKGGDLTVGGLSTPEGHYVIQSHGDTGWVASSALLFKVEPGHDDAIYPEDVIAQEQAQQEGEKNSSSEQHSEHNH